MMNADPPPPWPALPGPSFLEALRAFQSRRGRAPASDRELAERVRALSRIYTREREQIASAETFLEARLRFFLPRDLAKIQGPLRELARAGALPPSRGGAPLRVLDLGAGLGTTTLGLALYTRALGVKALEVEAVERDRAALSLLESLFGHLGRALSGELPRIGLTTHVANLEEPARLPRGPFDLILMGLALNELFADKEEEAAEEARLELLAELKERLSQGGSIVILEPALKGPSRALMRLGERAREAGLGVFAPCLREAPCPLLRRPRDWCHERLSLELPEGLAKIAEAAGLRSRDLSYAYLTLRRDGRRLRDRLEAAGGGAEGSSLARIVGGPVLSKGKREWDLCGAHGLARLRLLDRERGEGSAAVEEAGRGALLRLGCALEDGGGVRLRPPLAIERLDLDPPT